MTPLASGFTGYRQPTAGIAPGPERRFWLVVLALLVLTSAVYGRTLGHDFINFDDQAYVTENEVVREGLTLPGVVRSFGFMAGNWHPLTWFSHMCDVELFGMRAWGHHLVNLIFHATSTVLLFAVMQGMTGAFWRSAFVAALFAVHPLNVESVAWVAERKSVLSMFFFWLTLGAWSRWARRPSTARYAAVVSFFTLGLMAKPMLVTIPFVLLLLDWWPLGRFELHRNVKSSAKIAIAGRLLLEKLPLVALAIAAGVLTWLAQFTAPMKLFTPPLATRVANALVSYATYLWKMVWPANLGVLYPYPTSGIPAHLVAGAVLLLAGISIIATLRLRKQPSLAVGWYWYLGTLIPAIGLIQSGAQARADRYTYIPLVGIFIALTWLAGEVVPRKWAWRLGAASLATTVLIVLGVTASLQAGQWRDSFTLMEHTVRVTENNYMMLNNLGVALIERNRLDEARRVLENVLLIKADHVNAIFNLGNISSRQQRHQDAIGYYLRGLRYTPDNLNARFNLALVLFESGRLSEAAQHLNYIYRLNPAYPNLRLQLAMIEDRLRRATPTERLTPGR